jgi:hypothetical protein
MKLFDRLRRRWGRPDRSGDLDQMQENHDREWLVAHADARQAIFAAKLTAEQARETRTLLRRLDAQVSVIKGGKGR